jgi:hypothetical protein
MVWTDPGSLSTASVARTHGGGNTPRPAPATHPCRHTCHQDMQQKGERPSQHARTLRSIRRAIRSWQGARAARPSQPRDNGHMVERLEVQRAVAASAGEIFAVLSDPRGHVAIDSSGMLMEASGDTVTKVGDTFVVHMDREALNDYPLGLYDVTVEIVTFEPGREIAWTVRGQMNLGYVYGYRLEPIEEGVLVTSYYDWSAAEQSWKDAAIFPVVPESALRATLGILARTVAPGKPRPTLPAQ